MTLVLSSAGLSADDVAENTTARRTAAWSIVVAAVAAGCPVPQDVYVDGRGAGVSVTVAHLHDLAAWIVHFNAPPATSREYACEQGTRWQRTHTVEHIVGTVLVDVQHHDQLPAPHVAGAR